jgi:hypothetical protein
MNDTHPMILKVEIIFWKISIVLINFIIKVRSILDKSRLWVNQIAQLHPVVISLACALIGLSLGFLSWLVIHGD